MATITSTTPSVRAISRLKPDSANIQPVAEAVAVEHLTVDSDAVPGDTYTMVIWIWCFAIMACMNLVDVVAGFFR